MNFDRIEFYENGNINTAFPEEKKKKGSTSPTHLK
jgi:hypothetical protein